MNEGSVLSETACVVVTYNRLEILKSTLKSFSALTRKPSKIFVVNNNSTDGTKEFLKKWSSFKESYEKQIIELNVNLGASSGFYEGIKVALQNDYKWIWVSDDDAFPDPMAFSNFERFVEKFTCFEDGFENVAAICAQVINDNKTDVVHRRRIRRRFLSVTQEPVGENEYNKNYFELDLFSYVGTIMNSAYLRKAGLPDKTFYIYYDDTEHSLRLRKLGRIICVPQIKVVHNTLSRQEDSSWKGYYGIRNMLVTMKRHFGLICYGLLSVKFLARAMISIVITGNSQRFRLIASAVHDARVEKMGIHEVYKPGWTMKKRRES